MINYRIAILIATLALFSRCETAFETYLDDKKVMLLSPLNNHNTSDRSQLFYWEPLDGAISYQLQLVSPRFDSLVTLITDTTITFNELNLVLPKGGYQWRVRGLNNSSKSLFSSQWNLTVQ